MILLANGVRRKPIGGIAVLVIVILGSRDCQRPVYGAIQFGLGEPVVLSVCILHHAL